MMLWTQSQTAYHATGPSRVVLAAILLASGLLAEPGAGQTPGLESTVQVSVPHANFRADCSMSAEVVATLTEGEEVEVLDTAGNWHRVRHVQSGIEGCMHQTVLGPIASLSEERAEELEEREEEIREREAEAREAELEAREEEAERRYREAEWGPRRARGEKRVTGYLDLNIGYGTPGDDSLSYEDALYQFDPPPPTPLPNSHHETEFEYSADLTYGIGGGILMALPAGGSIGGGAILTRASYSVDLDLEASRRHLTMPGVIVEDRITMRAPDRTETAMHIHAVYAPPTPEPIRVRVFAGPTVFRTELPVWEIFVSTFFENPPRMQISELRYGERKETVVGGHVGADVAYFFSKLFGVGASAVYSRGTEEFDFSAPGVPADARTVREVTLGGLSATFGIRFRF